MQFEAQTYKIFPTPVMKFRFPRQFNNTELEFFKNAKNNSSPFRGSDTMSTDRFILNDQNMIDIKKFIDNCLDVYMKKIYNPHDSISPELYVTQSWINWMKPGTEHQQHTHANSVLSGSFYINANKKYDLLEFLKSDFNQFHILTKEYNEYNTYDAGIAVETYDLILFPSSLLHHVPPTQNPDVRVSLAFNTFLRGKIGNESTVSYLDI
jgi:uncharacterized protein (TIGR02466 family)